MRLNSLDFLHAPELALTSPKCTILLLSLIGSPTDRHIAVFSYIDAPTAYWWPRLFGQNQQCLQTVGRYHATEQGRNAIRKIFTELGLNPRPIAALRVLTRNQAD